MASPFALQHASHVWLSPAFVNLDPDPYMTAAIADKIDELSLHTASDEALMEELERRRRPVSKVIPMTGIYPTARAVRMPQKDFDRLVDDIGRCGVLHAISVRACKNGRYVILDGVSRYHAARKLGLNVIPATIYRSI